MKRACRILSVFLLPPALGTALFILVVAFTQKEGVKFVVVMPFLTIPVFGYAVLLTCIPSAFYSASIEIAYARGLSPRSKKSVVASMIFGVTVGATIALLAGSSRADSLLLFPAIGLIVGTALGFLFYLIDWIDSSLHEKAYKVPAPTPTSVTEHAAHAPRQP